MEMEMEMEMEIKCNMEQFAALELDFKKIDELWEQDVQNATKALACLKKIDKKDIERHAVENGELVKYIRDRVFPNERDGYYVVRNKNVMLMSDKVFNSKIKSKLDQKSIGVVKKAVYDNDGLYQCDVFDTDVTIDKEKKRINLARRFNFEYNPNAKVDKEKGEKLLYFFYEVISGSHDDQYKCILDILSCAAHRQQSEVVLFLCALGGVGKTFFCNIIRALFGAAFANTSEQVLSGECQFNKILIGAVFACLEETKGTENYPRLMRAIKELTTSNELMAREMFIDTYAIKNLINIIILSNYFGDIDVKERRVFSPDIDNKYQNNKEYFSTLKSMMTQEALQYVFNFLYTRKVQTPVEIPMTITKQMCKESNMHSVVRFLIEEHMFHPQENKTARLLDLWEQYQQYCEVTTLTGVAKVAKKDAFYETLKQYVLRAKNKDGKVKIIHGYELYDISYSALYETIITRSMVVTPERFVQMKEEYEDKNKWVNKTELKEKTHRKTSIEIQTETTNEFKEQCEFMAMQVAIEIGTWKTERDAWKSEKDAMTIEIEALKAQIKALKEKQVPTTESKTEPKPKSKSKTQRKNDFETGFTELISIINS